MRIRKMTALAVAAAGLIISAGPASVAAAAPVAKATTITLLPYQAKGWQYKQVAWNGDPGFQRKTYDVSSWSSGQAGFGTTNHVCSWNNPSRVHTDWGTDTDMLVRHWLQIPAGASDVHIAGSIDNDATIYINGHQVQYAQSGSCQPSAINATFPARDLDPRSLLAIRGHDTGDATYLEVSVTYTAG